MWSGETSTSARHSDAVHTIIDMFRTARRQMGTSSNGTPIGSLPCR